MAEDYESMTVAQLKEALKEMGLPVSGKKSDLLARLQEAAGQADLLLRQAPLQSEAVDAAETQARGPRGGDLHGRDAFLRPDRGGARHLAPPLPAPLHLLGRVGGAHPRHRPRRQVQGALPAVQGGPPARA